MTAGWWQDRVVYQIYPRSFQDSNGDGIGDIPGIISRLDDLQQLGVGIIWLSPVYRSPNEDNGYDISDYLDINPEYGTLDDMKRLIGEAGARDIKIIMDLVINHTSTEHAWFQQSRRGIEPYRDYYIWQPGRGSRLPNNWSGFFGESCWAFDEARGEYYLHLFARHQADLNYRNPAVLAEVEAIMRFWLDRGIAGFRCDVINILWKESLADGRRRLILPGIEHYLSTEGTHEILRRLRRDVLDHYDCFTVGETVFVTPGMGRDLCEPERRELDMIFAFEPMETDQWIVKWFKRSFNPGRFGKVIARWQNALTWNANYLENHDQPRSISRFGDDGRYWRESGKLLATLLLTLRGTPFIYQGQEIGMANFDFTSMDQIRDVESINIEKLARSLHFPARLRWRMIRRTSRDNARTPMQWDDSLHAGFSSGTPWLGVNGNYRRINLAAQKADPDSIFRYYQRLIHLRAASDILINGSFRLLRASRRYMAYERSLNGRRLTIFLNFSPRTLRIRRPSDAMTQVLSSADCPAFTGILAPYEAVILEYREVKS